jgi:hypothetical protein
MPLAIKSARVRVIELETWLTSASITAIYSTCYLDDGHILILYAE